MRDDVEGKVGTARQGGHSEVPRFAVSQIRCERGHADADLCRYQVAWTINPHMTVGQVDAQRAHAQHARLLAALRLAGAELIELPFVHGAFDSVFAKDNALLMQCRLGRMALLGRPKFSERQQEQRDRERALRQCGFEVFHSPCDLEGGDVVVLPNGRGALLGHGFRSAPRAARLLEVFLGVPVLPLELRDPLLYHLDTALCALDDGTLLLCEEAFEPDSLEALRRFPPAGALLKVPRAEALRFGVNLVQVNETVILGGSSPVVEAMLRLKGLSPTVVPLSEFQLAGGSAACLVSRLHSLERMTRRSEAGRRAASAPPAGASTSE